MRPLRLTSTLAALALVACATPTERFPAGSDRAIEDAPSGLAVRVLDGSVSVPGQVRVRVDNPTSLTYGVNLCAHGRLERLEGDTWMGLGEPMWLCTADLPMVQPGSSLQGTYGITDGTTAGTYRLRVHMQRDGAVTTISSNAFTVR